MADAFALSTSDPHFDPNKPVRVNGFLFLPAKRVLTGRARRPVLVDGARKRTIEA